MISLLPMAPTGRTFAALSCAIVAASGFVSPPPPRGALLLPTAATRGLHLATVSSNSARPRPHHAARRSRGLQRSRALRMVCVYIYLSVSVSALCAVRVMRFAFLYLLLQNVKTTGHINT